MPPVGGGKGPSPSRKQRLGCLIADAERLGYLTDRELLQVAKGQRGTLAGAYESTIRPCGFAWLNGASDR
jgi:hypothetical protein